MRKCQGWMRTGSVQRGFQWIGAMAALGLVVAAGPARAEVLPFTGSLLIQVATLDPIALTGSGLATVNGSGGLGDLTSLEIPGDIFGVTGFDVPVTDPGAAPIAGVRATAANGAGSFSGFPLGGPMQIIGVTKVCLFADCATPPPANISVPLDVVGVGGSESVTFFVNVTVTGNPWTIGKVNVGDAALTGFVHGPASGTTTAANEGGVVRLVTPVVVSTNIGPSALVPTFGILELSFVPEPGVFTLGLAAVGALVVMGLSRRQS